LKIKLTGEQKKAGQTPLRAYPVNLRNGVEEEVFYAKIHIVHDQLQAVNL
jgi:hypothetical protein